MRWSLWAILLLILLPIGQGALSSPCAAGQSALPDPGPKLVEVLVHFPWEHIGVINANAGELNLRGWSLSDGEGSWSIVDDLQVVKGGEVYLGTNLTFLGLLHEEAVLLDPMIDVTRKGRLVLADEGDEVMLLDPQGNLVDVLAYGKSGYAGAGWEGVKCQAPSEGKVLRRLITGAYSDSDSSVDWGVRSPGRSDHKAIRAEAMVEFFLSPDEMRARVIRELWFAQWTIDIAVYLLSDYEVAGALVAAAQRGVDVQILVEGQPVGGLTQAQVQVLEALSLAGCQVYRLISYHGFKRYDYLHCKCLIVDARRVLMASENFARESLDSNRGWGVCVESSDVAKALLGVLEQDRDPRYPDIQKIRASAFTDASSLPEPYHDPSSPAPSSFKASLETVLAPDFSYRTILDVITRAKSRLFLELFYFSDRWSPGLDPFQAIVDAARRGVSVRLLLDGNWYNNEDGKGNQALADRLNQIAALEHLDLIAKRVSPYHGFTTLHNKGMIVDDSVLVCSLNWVRAAFEQNREAGFMVKSLEVADFFARSFAEDWIDDSQPPVLLLPSLVQIGQGEELVLNASFQDNSGYARVSWDVNGDGSFESHGTFLATRLPVGEHRIQVRAVDGCNNSCITEVKVIVRPEPSGGEWPLIVLGASAAVLALWRFRKKIKWP